MLHVSQNAKDKIAELLQRDGKPKDAFVRVAVVAGGCSGFSYQMDFDTEDRQDDQVFEDNGVKIVTDPRSVLYLFGTTLDFSSGLNGKGFFFENPNATRTCGCGESFAV